MYFIHPQSGAIEALQENFPPGQPVMMLNLLRFRTQAHYDSSDTEESCTGEEAFDRYTTCVAPFLEAAGAESVWQGRQNTMVIGPDDKDWHLAILVKYPSAKHFVDMVSSPAYRAIAKHRTAALQDSRLIAMEER